MHVGRRTSTLLSEPNMEISGCISRMPLFPALMISRSCASYHDGDEWPGRRLITSSATGGKDGSSRTRARRSGVMPRCISNNMDGMQGRSRDARLRTP